MAPAKKGVGAMATITRQLIGRVGGIELPAIKGKGHRYMVTIVTTWGDGSETRNTLPATRELTEAVFGWAPEQKAADVVWSANGRGLLFATEPIR